MLKNTVILESLNISTQNLKCPKNRKQFCLLRLCVVTSLYSFDLTECNYLYKINMLFACSIRTGSALRDEHVSREILGYPKQILFTFL